MRCICRFACTPHWMHCPACHVHSLHHIHSLVWASITCHAQQAACQSVKRARRSLSRRPAAKDEVTATHEAGERDSNRSLPREEKSEPPARLTGQMLPSEAGHSWLDPSRYASILRPRAAVTAAPLPTRRINKNKQPKQTRARPRTTRAAAYITPGCLFSSSCVWRRRRRGVQCTHLPLASARHPTTSPLPPSLPPINQHAQPRLPFNGVTSPCGCGLLFFSLRLPPPRYRNRSPADAPLHAVAAGGDAAPRAQELLLEREDAACSGGRACVPARARDLHC